MSIHRRLIVALAVLLPASLGLDRSALAGDAAAASKIPTKNPLHRFVGSWRGEVTAETAGGKPASYTQENRFAWTLGGVFLEERGNASNGSSFAGFWAYFLAPAGDVVVLQHEWVEAKQSFVGAAELGGGVRMLAEDRFVSADAYEWSITVQDAQGTVLSRLRGRERRVRR
jgi:hypothetical protein